MFYDLCQRKPLTHIPSPVKNADKESYGRSPNFQNTIESKILIISDTKWIFILNGSSQRPSKTKWLASRILQKLYLIYRFIWRISKRLTGDITESPKQLYKIYTDFLEMKMSFIFISRNYSCHLSFKLFFKTNVVQSVDKF